MNDDIMTRAALRAETRLAQLERKWRWQRRLQVAIWLGTGMAAGMMWAGWMLYG